MTHIYFIEDPINKCVKIGKANSINSRLSCLQVGNVNDLKLRVAIYNVSDKIEQYIHEHFKDIRIKGEWFKAEALERCREVAFYVFNESGYCLPSDKFRPLDEWEYDLIKSRINYITEGQKSIY